MRLLMRFTGLFAVALSLSVSGCGGSGSDLSPKTPVGITAGAEETMGTLSGLRSSIAVDASGQPHVVSDSGLVSGPNLYFFDKVAGTWHEMAFDVQTKNPVTDWIFAPHIEIDSLGRAWATATMVRPGDGGEPGCGAAVMIRENVATDANASIHFSQNTVWETPWTWGQALSSLDPSLPDEAIVVSVNAFWSRFTYNASSVSRVTQGNVHAVPAIQGGEKMGFNISKAGSVAHATSGSHAVWHVAGHGFSKWDSGYQNTVRLEKGLEPVKFAAVSTYTALGDDYIWPGVCGDNLDPEIAYISSDYTDWRNGGSMGVQLNIYDPETDAMLFPKAANLMIDADGTSGTQRFPPSMAAARNGGVFVAWTAANKIYVQYVGWDGKLGPKAAVADGTCPAICVDQEGNIHLAYQNGGMFYRLLTVQY